MLFTSLEFFIFLPLVLAAFRIVPVAQRWAVLLVASYVFYGFWHPFFFSIGDHRLDRGNLRDIRHRCNGAPLSGFNLGDQLVCCICMCYIVHAYGRAALCQESGGRSADAPRSACHQRRLIAPRSHSLLPS